MKYIVIIPARSGSKRFPNKNIHPLNGIPLICHSINFAIINFDKCNIWVNTDSSIISDIVTPYGVNVYDRPQHLGSDYTSTIEVLKDQVESLISKNILFDAVILLQPTNPLRANSLIKEAIFKFENSNRSSLATFSKLNKKYGKIIEDFFLPTNYIPGQRMQDLSQEYFENGLIYITKVESILNNQIITSDTYPLVTEDDYSSVDIDYYEDLLFAEFLINKTKNNG